MKALLLSALVAVPFAGTAAAAERPGDRERPARAPAEGRAEEGITQPSPSPFRAGTWALHGYASTAAGKSGRKVHAGHVGLGYHVLDEVSLNLETGGYFIDQIDDTGGGGVNLLTRLHYWRSDAWSLYVDSGAGGIYTRDTLRDPGTHFNFTLQGGFGVTHKLRERIIPMAGLRWFHISNARIRGKDRNVAFDSPMFYIGLILPFKLR